MIRHTVTDSHGFRHGPRDYLGDLEQRNGVAYLELVAVTLARVHFKALDGLARATGTDSIALQHAAEVDALEAQ